MTEEEPRKAIQSGPPPSLEARMEWLEADASAQRTAILRLERQIKMLAVAVALAGIVASAVAVL